jgi:hypothetical protein
MPRSRSCPKDGPRHRRRCRLRWLALLIAGVVCTPAAMASAQGRIAARPDPEVDIRVFAAPALSESTQRQMRATADGILHAAGVSPRWHDCSLGTSDPECARPTENGAIVVRILAGYGSPAVTCGRAVHGAHRAAGVVTLYRGCVSDVMQSFRAYVDEPLLMRVRDGHVFGLLLVHEIGHVLGQSHARSGIMRAALTLDEWRDLAGERLSFSSPQGRTLRAAVAPAAESAVAQAH